MASIFTTDQPTKAAIMNTFLQLYATKPLGQITVKEISDICNLSRTTFYSYFEDTNAVYRACVYDAINYMEIGLSDIVLYTVGCDYDRYVEAFSSHLAGLKENLSLYYALLTGSEKDVFRNMWLQSIYTRCGQTLSFSRNLSAAVKDYLVQFFAAGQLSILSSWILSGCKDSAKNIAVTSAQVLFTGVYGSNINNNGK